MNDNEIKPLYVPENSGNNLPNLSKHPAHNETPVPLHRTRTEPSRAMSDDPMKHLLPSGTELRDIIRRRIKSRPMAAPTLWAALCQSYQTRPRQEQSLIDAIAGMLAERELEQRDGKLHVAEPDPTVPEIPAEMWTMTQTARVLHVLTEEPQTRSWLAEHTGLKPKQVSKAMNYLIGQGKAEVVGDVPRTWRLINTNPAETDTAVLTEQQTRDVLLERVGNGSVPITVVVDDVARLSGWQRAEVSTLIDVMLTEGDTIRFSDGRIVLPKPASYQEIQEMVARSEDPPPYEIGDDDDGEIGEPGISRPDTSAYVPDSATIDFVRRDSGGHVADECSVTIDADGLSFGGGDVMPFEAIDALMPTLKRVHRAVFGGGDG